MKIQQAELVPAKDVEVEGAKDCRIRLLIHKAEGAPNFYMRQFTIAPGGHTPLHRHDWEHEVYILAGAGTAATPDGPRPFAAGDCIYVAPNDEHQFRNTGTAEVRLLCVIPSYGK